jgi:hypothetical protein
MPKPKLSAMPKPKLPAKPAPLPVKKPASPWPWIIGLAIAGMAFIGLVLVGFIALIIAFPPAPTPNATNGTGPTPPLSIINVYVEPVDEDSPFYYEYSILDKEKIFEEHAKWINSYYDLPEDMLVWVRECGTANAFWDPQNRQIIICYELMKVFEDEFRQITSDEEQVEAYVLQATFFVFYHELGHGLISMLDLPITGKEEDAVDQFSAVLFLESDQDQVVITSAYTWYVFGQQADIEDLPFWDEHSLELQRYYNLLCWVYGKDPDGYAWLVEDGYLPESRAVRCPAEYQQITSSWNRLLEPYVITEDQPAQQGTGEGLCKADSECADYGDRYCDGSQNVKCGSSDARCHCCVGDCQYTCKTDKDCGASLAYCERGTCVIKIGGKTTASP